MRCDSCGFDNPPTAKFCQECGARLAEVPRESMSSAQGERRQLTILFSDLVGSTELSTRLDPEEWRDVVVQYHRAASDAITHAGGRVAQFQGDGIIAFFGYPEASEDAAMRGVRAGLALITAIEQVNSRLKARDLTIAVRVGVHTGLVMIGAGADLATWVFGETPNVASRVQTEAQPNTVYVSSATQRLVASAFVFEDCGEHNVKGVAKPMHLYRAVQPATSRVQSTATVQAHSPFVGRVEEMGLLRRCWESCLQGAGQVVLTIGEAGIGKTRLLQQFKSQLLDANARWIESNATSYEHNTPFAPIVELLNQAFGWTQDKPAELRVQMLEQSFRMAGLDPAVDVPLVSPMLGLELPAGYIPPLMSPDQQRRKLLAALLAWALESARLQPLVVLIEDLQWADPSTMELLGQLVEQCAGAPIMLLLTARPEFKAPWLPQPHVHTLMLRRLDHSEVQKMITTLISRMLPGQTTLEDLAARTDGVPLFVEEVTRAMVESGQITAAMQQVPSTLQDLLMARLDRLGSTKELAQVGAVLGREFSLSLLRAVSGLSNDELNAGLLKLMQAEIIQPLDLQTGFEFQHVLMRDAAYDSLLKGRRRELHLAAAKAIAEQFPEIAAQKPELLAQHYTEGGEAELAVDAWEAAGLRNMASAALAEATQNFQRAIDVLYTMPDTPERAQRELPLQLSLGQSVQGVCGFGSPDMANAFGRARQIAQQLGEEPSSFFVMLGIWASLDSRSEIIAGQEMSDELMRLAKTTSQPAMITWANLTRALGQYMRADLTGAIHHVMAAKENYREEDHLWYPFNPLITTYIHYSLSLWHIGRVEEALQCNAAQLEYARRLSPANEALAHLTACSLQVYLGDGRGLMASANELTRIGRENKLESFLTWGAMYETYAKHLLGQTGLIQEMREAIARYLATGTRSSLGLYLSMLARMYGEEGRMDEGLTTVEDGFSAATEEQIHWLELLRVQGDLLALKGKTVEAEQAYRLAMSMSEDDGACMQQLRAGVRLATLIQGQGKVDEAKAMLAPLVSSVPDAHNTDDMQHARILLDPL